MTLKKMQNRYLLRQFVRCDPERLELRTLAPQGFTQLQIDQLCDVGVLDEQSGQYGLTVSGRQLARRLFYHLDLLGRPQLDPIRYEVLLVKTDTNNHGLYLKDTFGNLTADLLTALWIEASDYRTIKQLKREYHAQSVAQLKS